jgi:hypothetical protein
MKLGELFNKYKADKTIKHKYDTVYEKYFEPIKDDQLNILEIGVYKGSSTLALHEYFPHATLYGLDLFKRVPMEQIEPYGLERCNFVKGDSTFAFDSNLTNIKFDIIIDDGMHTPIANTKTFRNFKPLLADDGQYFIEDVWPIELMSEEEMQHQWIKNHPFDYNVHMNKIFLQTINDSGMNIERFDLRKTTGHPDSYIIRLTNEKN